MQRVKVKRYHGGWKCSGKLGTAYAPTAQLAKSTYNIRCFNRDVDQTVKYIKNQQWEKRL